MGAAFDLALDGCDEIGMAVTEEQRSVAHHVVDHPVAVDVPLVRPGSAVVDDAERLEEADIVGDAAGEDGAGAVGALGGAGMELDEALVDRRGHSVTLTERGSFRYAGGRGCTVAGWS